ncbi:MAG: hypothetical protein LUQ18_01420 [Methylococcaceae bacterium]|nr:hypothetical protein [Methylococcaceae bacterium]
MRQIFLSILALAFVSDTFADYKLYEGEHGALSAGLQLQTASFSELNNQSGGSAKDNLTDVFLELSAKPYLNAALNLPTDSKLYGGFSYVYSSTTGHDPSGYTEDNVDLYFQETDYTELSSYNNYRGKSMTEELYLGWQSGKLLDNAGKNTLDISLGRQNYKLGSGFLLFYGADNGGKRGAGWLNPRTAFDNTLIGRVNVQDVKLEGFHLETRPLNPAEKRHYQGGNIEYKPSERASVGLSYINTTNSRSLHDEGSTIPLAEQSVNNDTYDARADFSPLPDVTLSAEYVHQVNTETTSAFEATDKTRVHADGGFGGIEYKRQDLLWQPAVSYRYAIQDEHFDAMSPGFTTWGTWFQGEINGEWVLNNTNLITHQGKLVMTPTENLALNLVYLNYQFMNPDVFALTASHYGNEVDFLTDWEINETVSLYAGIEAFVPDEAGKQYLGGNKVWLQGMAAASFEF